MGRSRIANLTGNAEDSSVRLSAQWIDHDFFDTYRISLLAGRIFSRERSNDGLPIATNDAEAEWPKGSVVINATAARQLGMKTPEEAIGQIVYTRTRLGPVSSPVVPVRLEIIGVTNDVQFDSLKQATWPEMYFMQPRHDIYLSAAAVRYSGDSNELVREIEKIWKSMMPSVAFRYEYADDLVEATLSSEDQQGSMLALFSLLAIFLSCLGLYGLAAFNSERRTKEIGIRKVMGADIPAIVRLLLWQSSKPVFIANLIAWPIGAWGMLSWLETFPYRIDEWLIVGICAFAGLVSLLISSVTVSYHTTIVARTKPVIALQRDG